MLDAIGFGLASAFLGTTFAIFLALDRLVSGVASELRYTIAPSIVSGVREWAHDRHAGAGRIRSDEASGGSGGRADDDLIPDPLDAGFNVPVVPLDPAARRH